jgi:hypothetical protein
MDLASAMNRSEPSLRGTPPVSTSAASTTRGLFPEQGNRRVVEPE